MGTLLNGLNKYVTSGGIYCIDYRSLYHTVYYITCLYAPTCLYLSIRQFRAEQTESCDYSNMVEILANTDINTVEEDEVCNGVTYSMADWNWMDQDPPFEPNVASAFYLPPVVGCRWELYLLKRFDPIVGNDNCQCDDEDHVHFEDGDGNERKYCDFTDPPESTSVGWCANNFGPHNVHIQPAFVTGNECMPCYIISNICASPHLLHWCIHVHTKSIRANNEG